MANIFTAGRWRVAAAVLGAVVLVLGIFAVLFDWNWLRGPIVHHLEERSGREVRVADLDVDFESFLEPTVRLRGVYVQNAGWASSKEPLIEARELSFRFAVSSLWGDNYEVTHLTLIGAKVDMERSADGRRNWRLRKPEDTGPGRVRVMRLEARDSQVRFLNHEIDLELVAVATPLERVKDDAYGLTTRIAYSGAYEGHAFSGEAATPPAISFRGSAFTFPAKGHLVSRGARVEFDGHFTDLFDIGPFDAHLRVAAPSLSALYPFLRVQPPPSKPFSVETQVTQAGGVYEFADIRGTIGSTPLTADATYGRSGERPYLKAVVASEAAVLTDIEPLMGKRTAGTDDRPEGSKRPLRLAGLRGFDARVDARAARLRVAALPPLEDVRIAATIDRGVVDFKSAELRVGGGRVTASGSFDARSDKPKAQLAAQMRGANLARLLPAAESRRLAGELSANLKVSSEGESSSALLDNLRGSFDARLNRGTISNLADAKLGLEFGKVIGIYLRGERDIAIGCAFAAFDLRGGVARSRQITFDSEQTRVDGTGTVDLKSETVDFVLTPEAKNPGLFTRRASLRVRGPLGKPATSIEERIELPQARCAA
jgi:AsmA family protein